MDPDAISEFLCGGLRTNTDDSDPSQVGSADFNLDDNPFCIVPVPQWNSELYHPYETSNADANTNAFNFNSMPPDAANPMARPPAPTFSSLHHPQPLNTTAAGFMKSGIVEELDSPVLHTAKQEELPMPVSGNQLSPYDHAHLYHRVPDLSSHSNYRQHMLHRAETELMFVPERNKVAELDGEDEYDADNARSGYCARGGSGGERQYRRRTRAAARQAFRRNSRRLASTTHDEPTQRSGTQGSRYSAGIRKRSASHSRRARNTIAAPPSHNPPWPCTAASGPSGAYLPTINPNQNQSNPLNTLNISDTINTSSQITPIDPFPSGPEIPPKTSPLHDPINLFILHLRRDQLRQWPSIAAELNARKNALGLPINDFTEAAVYGRFTRNGSRIAQRLGQPAFDPRDFMHIKEGGGLRSGRAASHAVASGLVGSGVVGGATGGAAAEHEQMKEYEEQDESVANDTIRANTTESVTNHQNNLPSARTDDTDYASTEEEEALTSICPSPSNSNSNDTPSFDDEMLQAAVDRAASGAQFWNTVAGEYADMHGGGRRYDGMVLRSRHGRLASGYGRGGEGTAEEGA